MLRMVGCTAVREPATWPPTSPPDLTEVVGRPPRFWSSRTCGRPSRWTGPGASGAPPWRSSARGPPRKWPAWCEPAPPAGWASWCRAATPGWWAAACPRAGSGVPPAGGRRAPRRHGGAGGGAQPGAAGAPRPGGRGRRPGHGRGGRDPGPAAGRGQPGGPGLPGGSGRPGQRHGGRHGGHQRRRPPRDAVRRHAGPGDRRRGRAGRRPRGVAPERPGQGQHRLRPVAVAGWLGRHARDRDGGASAPGCRPAGEGGGLARRRRHSGGAWRTWM